MAKPPKKPAPKKGGARKPAPKQLTERQADLAAAIDASDMMPEYPAPPPPGPKPKFWRQYQDETGKFIGWRKALTKTKDQVISRLRLREKPA